MKKINKLILISILCIFSAFIFGCQSTKSTSSNNTDSQRVITDDAGRKVKVPAAKDIKKIYSTSGVGTLVIYSLCPEKVAGWNHELSTEEKRFIPKQYQNLPTLGKWSGKNGTGSAEQVMKEKPDLIVSMGNVDSENIDTVNSMQKQLGIPVILVDGALTKMDKCYKFLGEVTGDKEKAKELADYCSKTVNDAKKLAASIDKSKKVRVYYAEGPKGLQTDPSGTLHAEILDIVGAINVANVDKNGNYGRADVSMEQVLGWNPDVVMASKDFDDDVYKEIANDKVWKNVKAVKDKRVYQIPTLPDNFFDRPPSVNRIIGIKWAGNMLYPDVFKMNIKDETKKFYELFYHCKLTDTEVNEVLETKNNF